VAGQDIVKVLDLIDLDLGGRRAGDLLERPVDSGIRKR
jgi:hypothetical protein